MITTALICAGIVSSAAYGQAGRQTDPTLERLTRGFNDVTTFATNTSLVGYSGVEPRTGQRITMFYDPTSKVVIYGVGFDLGANKQLGPQIAIKGRPIAAPTGPDPEMAPADHAKISGVLSKMAFVEVPGVNADGKILYVVVEPGCGYCQTAYRDLMPLLANARSPISKLTIRWVPVSLRPTHFQQVAASLDPATGGPRERADAIFARPAGKQPSGAANRLATANLGAFQTVKFQGTPTFLMVKDKQEKVSVGYRGVEEIAEWVK